MSKKGGAAATPSITIQRDTPRSSANAEADCCCEGVDGGSIDVGLLKELNKAVIGDRQVKRKRERGTRGAESMKRLLGGLQRE